MSELKNQIQETNSEFNPSIINSKSIEVNSLLAHSFEPKNKNSEYGLFQSDRKLFNLPSPNQKITANQYPDKKSTPSTHLTLSNYYDKDSENLSHLNSNQPRISIKSNQIPNRKHNLHFGDIISSPKSQRTETYLSSRSSVKDPYTANQLLATHRVSLRKSARSEQDDNFKLDSQPELLFSNKNFNPQIESHSITSPRNLKPRILVDRRSLPKNLKSKNVSENVSSPNNFRMENSQSDFGEEDTPRKFYSSNQLSLASSNFKTETSGENDFLKLPGPISQPRQSFEYHFENTQNFRKRSTAGSKRSSQNRKINKNLFRQSGVSQRNGANDEYSFRDIH